MDIFNILTQQQSPQQNNPIQEPKQENIPDEKPQKNPPTPKTFMQTLIEDGKQDLSEYVVEPKKGVMSKSKIIKEFQKRIQYLDPCGTEYFVECIKMAKHKKINLTKIEIKIQHKLESYSLNPLEYLLYSLTYNLSDMETAVKYLLANEPRFLSEKNSKDYMYAFLLFDTYKGKQKISFCGQEFLRTYKLLIDCGLKTPDISEILFVDDTYGSLVNEDYDLIELLLYSNNPELNQKILTSFYTCRNPEKFYPILERYGIKPDLNVAIASLKYKSGKCVLEYLIDAGVFDKTQLTDERIHDAIVEQNVIGYVTASIIVQTAKEIRDGTQQEIKARQKQVEEQEKQKQQQLRAQMQKQEIDQVFENAVKNMEHTQ